MFTPSSESAEQSPRKKCNSIIHQNDDVDRIFVTDSDVNDIMVTDVNTGALYVKHFTEQESRLHRRSLEQPYQDRKR